MSGSRLSELNAYCAIQVVQGLLHYFHAEIPYAPMSCTFPHVHTCFLFDRLLVSSASMGLVTYWMAHPVALQGYNRAIAHWMFE